MGGSTGRARRRKSPRSTAASAQPLHPPKVTRSGTAALRPRARIIKAMGEDLISNGTIALVELIKNAYDADARRVEISFEEPLVPGRGAVVVSDSGHGMTLTRFHTAWMEPATPTKRKVKRSPGGRRMTGEKGLGRFAAARLAGHLHLESIATSPRRKIVADVDWNVFSRAGYLDEVEFSWEEHIVPRGTPTGTSLRMHDLRERWGKESFERLRAELSRLVARLPKSEFEIRLELPEQYEQYAGAVTPPAVLEHPHYTLVGSMSKTGRVTATLGIHGDEEQVAETIVLGDARRPTCGPFKFEFKVWDRGQETLQPLVDSLGSTLKQIRADLDQGSGVSIYRDSFRVLPYGDPKNDWLRLDLRRVQNPTLRLSNNQIMGSIHISSDGNPALRDQTNREGLVETQALDDLRFCVKHILTKLELRRRDARRDDRESKPESQRRLFAELEIEPIAASFRQRYPDDTEFLAFLDARARTASESIKRAQEVVVRYRRLATLGQLVDVILHDGRQPVATIANRCVLGIRELVATDLPAAVKNKLSARFNSIVEQAEVLSVLFERIAPFGGRRRGRPKRQPIEHMITNVFELLSSRIDRLGVRVSLPGGNTLVTMDGAELQQIIWNLLDNALYWLEKVPKQERAISVTVSSHDEGLDINFADSGPGVAEEHQDKIFEPYFTTKPDGVGLGLTIAGEIAADYDGELALVAAGLLPGANFKVTLRRRVGDEDEEEIADD